MMRAGNLALEGQQVWCQAEVGAGPEGLWAWRPIPYFHQNGEWRSFFQGFHPQVKE